MSTRSTRQWSLVSLTSSEDSRCTAITKGGERCRRFRTYILDDGPVVCAGHLSAERRLRAQAAERASRAAFRAALSPADREELARRARVFAEGIPACWSWPTERPTEDEARHTFAMKVSHFSPEVVARLWGMEKAADFMDDQHILSLWQAGRCAICGIGSPVQLVCDHDHATGLVRGWLCSSCNTQEGVNRRPGTAFARYRERHPAVILGLTIPYLDPYTGEYAEPRRTE